MCWCHCLKTYEDQTSSLLACSEAVSRHRILFKSIWSSINLNKSLSSGIFPTTWKEALIRALHKKGDKSLPNNYRPISLTSCLSKVFERAVFKHVFQYLTNNKLIINEQSGFIPGLSTETQLLEIYDLICKALDGKQCVDLIFCDYPGNCAQCGNRLWPTEIQSGRRQRPDRLFFCFLRKTYYFFLTKINNAIQIANIPI